MLKNRVLFSLLVFSAALIFHSSTVHAQSYSIKPIVTYFNEITLGSGLFVRYINTTGGLSLNNNGDLVFPVLLTDRINNRGDILKQLSFSKSVGK